MNNFRLSTYKNAPVDIISLNERINILLNSPSNLEKKDGRVFIKSLNKYYYDRKEISIHLIDKDGLVFQSFDSISRCASFLGLS
jgi:hypothetical protein